MSYRQPLVDGTGKGQSMALWIVDTAHLMFTRSDLQTVVFVFLRRASFQSGSLGLRGFRLVWLVIRKPTRGVMIVGEFCSTLKSDDH